MVKATVELVSYTGHGNPDKMYAARLLVYTKNTRLQEAPGGFSAMQNLSDTALIEELAYMAATLPSSWEFVELVFLSRNVSRVCAQQITRTRSASYAMQAQRVTDMRSATHYVPDSLTEEQHAHYEQSFREAMTNYEALLDDGVAFEDARGILPGHIHCNIIHKYNLRAFVDLYRSRSSLRVQGEYVDIVRQMVAACLEVWPWAGPFFKMPHAAAVEIIERIARDLPKEQRIALAKAADLLKKTN